ncbi:MAG: DUF6691 family protein [Arenimonas sp.]
MSSNSSTQKIHYAVAALAGSLFGLGLAISQMTNPNKVLNFLDVFGDWDPSLGFVMLGALLVSGIGFALVKRRGTAVFGDLQVPPNSTIDAKLMIGAALFGIGWGIAGYCPGPALANLAGAWDELRWFIPAMLGGFYIAHLLQSKK